MTKFTSCIHLSEEILAFEFVECTSPSTEIVEIVLKKLFVQLIMEQITPEYSVQIYITYLNN
jgi:hypothetical protein